MTAKTRVSPHAAPASAHTFSQGVRKGSLVQVSGRGPVDPATNEYRHLVTAHTPSGILPSRTTVISGLPRAEMLVEIDGLAVIA